MMTMGSSKSGMWKLELEAEEKERGGDGDEDEDENEEEMRILRALRWAGIREAVKVTPDRFDIKSRRWQRKKRVKEEGKGLTGE